MPGFRVSLSHASGSLRNGVLAHGQGLTRCSVWDGKHGAVQGEPSMQMVRVYLRALGMLAPERVLALTLAAAAIAIAAVQLAEPVLFGRVVDALSRGEEAFPIIGLWALLGLGNITATTALAI